MEEPEVEVNPGKVTWMTAAWGNERFDPALAPGGDPNQYGRLITGYLIEISDDFELIPGMATDWALSSDGLTWTVTLRDGVKFHDGTEVTTDDVLWTWQHFYSHESREWTTSGAMWALENILDKMEKVGDDQVSITTTTPHTGIADYYFSRRSPVWYGALPARDTISGAAEARAYDKNPIGTTTSRRMACRKTSGRNSPSLTCGQSPKRRFEWRPYGPERRTSLR
jgi:ABC-type transport system substrate-binding protein